MNIIDKITSYLEYLKKRCGYTVSVHIRQNIFESIPLDFACELLKYNCHTNVYCSMAKISSLEKCIAKQFSILNGCLGGDGFCDVCYAGVCQVIYPITLRGERAGFVAVSGYRRNLDETKNILNYDLWNVALSTEIPLEMCNVLIPPLCIMMEQLLATELRESDNEYNLILQFLSEYYASTSLQELAKHFGRSKSHISHLFKKNCGMSIRAYCNNLKLESAKSLLLNTDFSVTEIAFDSGFNDTSYFIHLFKEKFGVSPLQYKQRNRIRTKNT